MVDVVAIPSIGICKMMVVIAPINNKIVIIPFNETQNLTKLKTTLIAYVDGSNIIILNLALVGINKPNERTCFILSKENVA